jgi:hypothetical protein
MPAAATDRLWLPSLALAAFAAAACGGNGAGVGMIPDGGGDDVAPDAGNDDAVASTDGALRSTDAPDAPVERPTPPAPYARPTYEHLSETGLLDDVPTRRAVSDALPFEPTYKLWSDAATKRRWVRLPPGTRIDTRDMDHWVFPVGTKLWKEFSLDGQPLETRLIERYGAGPEDFWFGAFVWNADHTDAVFAPDGQKNINGTAHDAPTQKECGICHRGDVGRVLGLSAIQLSRAGSAGAGGSASAVNSPTIDDLASLGLLSNPPASPGGFPVPGDATTAMALGTLHANCGHCHNQNGTSWPDTQMVLRLTVAERDPATSAAYQSIVGQSLQYWRGGAIKLRVSPGHPEQSALVVRMSARGSQDQMPPIATEIVDMTGLDAVTAWIASLAP